MSRSGRQPQATTREPGDLLSGVTLMPGNGGVLKATNASSWGDTRTTVLSTGTAGALPTHVCNGVYLNDCFIRDSFGNRHSFVQSWLSPHRPLSRTQTNSGEFLVRRNRAAGVSQDRRRVARASLVRPAEGGHRPCPFERFLILRPDAGHHRDAGRGAETFRPPGRRHDGV